MHCHMKIENIFKRFVCPSLLFHVSVELNHKREHHKLYVEKLLPYDVLYKHILKKKRHSDITSTSLYALIHSRWPYIS